MAEIKTIRTKDLVDLIVAEKGCSKKDAKESVALVLDEMTKNLKKGNIIDLSGFGKFQVKKRAARMGVNPATGEKIKIKASKKLAFRAAKALKEAVK